MAVRRRIQCSRRRDDGPGADGQHLAVWLHALRPLGPVHIGNRQPAPVDDAEGRVLHAQRGVFSRFYPTVRLRADRFLCPAGAEHRLITSGGSASWTDLALYLIARFCGTAEAMRIARIFVIGDHSDGQLPFAAMSSIRYHEDAVVEACQMWLAGQYAEPHPVRRMVQRSGLPERTFKRRFKAATGYAAVEYVQILRVEEAKQLLETSRAPVDVIAHEVGYRDPTFFRRLFKRRTGVTPARYRQRFQIVRPPGAAP